MAKKVTVTWTDPNPTTNVDHIEIWRKTGSGGTYAKISGNIALGVQTYEDTNGGSGLSDSQEYYYQVRAYNPTDQYSNIEGNVTISSGYLLRIVDSDNYNFVDATSGYTVVDPQTFKFSCTINPSDLAAIRYLFECGLPSHASAGLFQLRINTDGTLRLTRNDESGANSNILTSTTAIVAGQDNTISLVDGVLTINGVNQNIDISAWGDVNIVDGSVNSGTNLFATKQDGTGGFTGDVKALNYFGTDAVFASGGVTLSPPGRTLNKYGTETMVQY